MSTRIWRPLTLTTERLDALLPALRSLDADIEKLLHPQLRECPFYADTGVIVTPTGQHHHVPMYTKDTRVALSLPKADPSKKHALDIVTDWLKRCGE